MSRTALLIIDVQVALMDGAWRADEVLANIAALLARARAAGAPVVFQADDAGRAGLGDPPARGAAAR